MTSVLLCGGGHAQLFVLEALAQARPGGATVTLISARRLHAYSGMLPGMIGGRYAEAEISVDLAALALAAGANFVEGEISGFAAGTRTVSLRDGRQFSGDLVSLAVGSTVAGLELPGVREFACMVKPIERALAIGPALDAASARADGLVHVVVVGGGAAGCELAWAARARLAAQRRPARVTIVEHGASVLADRRATVRRAAIVASDRLGVAIETRAVVASVGRDAVTLQDARVLPADVCIWAAGSRALPWLLESGLTCDAHGYVQVDAELRALHHDGIYAAGDTAAPILAPSTPKAGVYAVRAGPILAANLLATIRGAAPAAQWMPQRDFLALLNTGDGRAILSWRRIVLKGRWVMRLKDRIDQGFLQRFRSIGAAP